MRKAAKTVDKAVMITESATSAFAIKLMTLLAVLPGAHPTRINPAENSGGSELYLASLEANRGIIVNWDTNPSNTNCGCKNTLLKSSAVRVMPINVMVTTSAGVTMHWYALKLEAKKYPDMEANKTQRGKRLVIQFIAPSITFSSLELIVGAPKPLSLVALTEVEKE